MAESDPYTPIKGKCIWWREVANHEDLFNTRLKDAEKRIECTCFVEGYRWDVVSAEVPEACPRTRMCRYYIMSR